ncbi:hypothetical protein AK812_SmicGene37134 [Symbiodinium microadriaticum]|uniref:Uncharacterized protein n=1 Tax=Symbiodinium microadriaticum TaxID=2951 RepID=A0A1Q9CH07_SYMMI|nr:hypothetical protein AK812_SmicGene37134 [Symbiodinium microadriaticum]
MQMGRANPDTAVVSAFDEETEDLDEDSTRPIRVRAAEEEASAPTEERPDDLEALLVERFAASRDSSSESDEAFDKRVPDLALPDLTVGAGDCQSLSLDKDKMDHISPGQVLPGNLRSYLDPGIRPILPSCLTKAVKRDRFRVPLQLLASAASEASWTEPPPAVGDLLRLPPRASPEPVQKQHVKRLIPKGDDEEPSAAISRLKELKIAREEWTGLWDKEVFDFSQTCEYDDVVSEAKKKGPAENSLAQSIPRANSLRQLSPSTPIRIWASIESKRRAHGYRPGCFEKDRSSRRAAACCISYALAAAPNGDPGVQWIGRTAEHIIFLRKQLGMVIHVYDTIAPLIAKWNDMINVQTMNLAEFTEIWEENRQVAFSSNGDVKSWFYGKDSRDRKRWKTRQHC